MAELSFKPPKTIGVFAPSSYVEKQDIEDAKAALEAQGHHVLIHPQTYERHHQSAGTHSQKIDALHALYTDQSIDAIWAAGGGNRSLHMLDRLDFDLIRNNPKPMIGFSDVTALLNGITFETGIANIHAPVFKQLSHRDGIDALLAWDFKMPMDNARLQHQGRVTAKLFGGNLSLFQYLADAPACEGAILFFEDCNEEFSRIDRMLTHLRRRGVLARAAGLVFGQFTDLKDSSRPFGYTLDDIISEHVEGLNIPVATNAPFGHGRDNYPILIGGTYTFDCTNARISLTLESE